MIKASIALDINRHLVAQTPSATRRSEWFDHPLATPGMHEALSGPI